MAAQNDNYVEFINQEDQRGGRRKNLNPTDYSTVILNTGLILFMQFLVIYLYCS